MPLDRVKEAEGILRANDRGGYTVPAQGLYPFQWLWDSGFVALGWAVLDGDRAFAELETLFLGQWENGFLPHIVFHREDAGYFPGPEIWGSGRKPQTSGITQPPFLAPVLLHLARKFGEKGKAQARKLYPRLLALHRFLHLYRDPEGTGLVAVLHPWETGMDNSPAWDLPLKRVPRYPVPPEARRDTKHVPPEERPRLEDYERYLYLVSLFRSLNYDPASCYRESPFRVVDVGFNALLLFADEALVELAGLLGEDPSEPRGWWQRGLSALEALWDEEAGLYRSLDLFSGKRIPRATSAGFLPLLLPLPRSRAERLLTTFRSWAGEARYLFPSVLPSALYFEARRYWRGPVWAPVNWLLAWGLVRQGFHEEAARLKKDLLALVEGSGFREYYHPFTGEGLGGRGFSWTAALYLAWVQGQDSLPVGSG
ncbi:MULTISPECIES: trehalase family glycosidase [Thermus]|uniref:Neutral trehalase n=1 Tax=Thermus antranikianii TaxID=88190 RepID=A0ABY7RQM2_9DEIN|nr:MULTISPECIES: trehalase family glycosidase [Thermus]ULR41593.1 neutral trehalase [Thermus sp. NEB1569]WCM39981.1 neutral trehalase [Thermus antranikianii]GBD40159.1 Cytoplasmic trehalase [bacterium HR38]